MQIFFLRVFCLDLPTWHLRVTLLIARAETHILPLGHTIAGKEGPRPTLGKTPADRQQFAMTSIRPPQLDHQICHACFRECILS